MGFSPGSLAQPAAPVSVGQQRANRPRQGGAVARGDDYARVFIQLLAYAAYVSGDHGSAAAHGFQDHRRQALPQTGRDDDGGR